MHADMNTLELFGICVKFSWSWIQGLRTTSAALVATIGSVFDFALYCTGS
jgi:hypothetical protein